MVIAMIVDNITFILQGYSIPPNESKNYIEPITEVVVSTSKNLYYIYGVVVPLITIILLVQFYVLINKHKVNVSNQLKIHMFLWFFGMISTLNRFSGLLVGIIWTGLSIKYCLLIHICVFRTSLPKHVLQHYQWVVTRGCNIYFTDIHNIFNC
jgi:hypothetical protein